MEKELPNFQRYQLAFSAHIRDPQHQPKPKNAASRGIAVYKEIVFNNLFESISACFPVAQKVLGKRAWLNLVRSFLREHSANTPIFREIPEEFLSFLSTHTKLVTTNLPPYLLSLCHYEWIELAVSSQVSNVAESDICDVRTAEDLLAYQPAFTPTMQLLNYEYAVQKISPRYKPKEKVSTQLLVYRDAEYNVKFVELNAVTYRLIELLLYEKTTGEHALTLIANELNHPQPEIIIQFGMSILEDFTSQGIILGVLKPHLKTENQ
ncbi:MAG: putative DNA-binding domain-containing protein [Methylotenera sp.]